MEESGFIRSGRTAGDARPRTRPDGMPSAAWALNFASRWSASKSKTAVKALAWNILGAFREWFADGAPLRQDETDASPREAKRSEGID